MSNYANKDHRITIRLTEEQYDILRVCAYTIGRTPSAYLRMIVDSTVNAYRAQVAAGKISPESTAAIKQAIADQRRRKKEE